MWIADGWKDYELLDCGSGEKLERWGKQILVRPDPQAIWESPRKDSRWRNPDGRYFRSSTGGGHWDKGQLPEQWQVSYKDLYGDPMSLSLTGAQVYDASRNLCSFTMDALLAAELRTIVDVAIYEGDIQISNTLRYCAETYAANTYNTTLESLT